MNQDADRSSCAPRRRALLAAVPPRPEFIAESMVRQAKPEEAWSWSRTGLPLVCRGPYRNASLLYDG